MNLTVTFCYLGGGQAEEVSHTVSSTWLEEARERLELALEAAGGPAYPQQPGPRCRSCDFTRFCDAGAAWLEADRD